MPACSLKEKRLCTLRRSRQRDVRFCRRTNLLSKKTRTVLVLPLRSDLCPSWVGPLYLRESLLVTLIMLESPLLRYSSHHPRYLTFWVLNTFGETEQYHRPATWLLVFISFLRIYRH